MTSIDREVELTTDTSVNLDSVASHYEIFDTDDYLKTPTKTGDGAAIARRFLEENPILPDDPRRLRRFVETLTKGFDSQAAAASLTKVEVNKFIINQREKKGKKENMGNAQEYGLEELQQRAAKSTAKEQRRIEAERQKIERNVIKELSRLPALFTPSKPHSPRKSRSPVKSLAKKAPQTLPALEEDVLGQLFNEDIPIIAAPITTSVPASPTALETAPKRKPVRKPRKPRSLPPAPAPAPAPARSTRSGRTIRPTKPKEARCL